MSPITGTFAADFSSFLSAVTAADLKLKDFQGDSAKVESALTRMGNSLSGTKLIQDAVLMSEAVERVGGASKLTEQEMARVGATTAAAVEKMRAMGIDIPPQLARVEAATRGIRQESVLAGETFGRLVAAFSASRLIDRAVDTLVSFAREAGNSAGQLVDMNAKTGVSIEGLQRMAFVAQQTSTELSTFTGAAFQLSQRIAGGAGSVRQAAEDLGLEWERLRAQKPEEQFDAVVAAAERMSNEGRRNNDILALVGRTGADILPAIAQGYSKIAQQAKVAGDAQVRAVDDAADRWEKFKDDLHTGFLDIVGSALLVSDAQKKLTIQQQLFFGQIAGAVEGSKEWNDALIAAAGAHDINIPKVRAEAAATHDYTAELDAALLAYLNLTPAQEAAIKAADRLGVSNDDLANSLGLAVNAVVLAKKEFQEYDEALKREADTTAATADAIAKTIADLDAKFQARQAAHGTPNEQAIAQINKERDDAIAAATKAGTLTDEVLSRINRNAQQQLGEVGIAWGDLAKESRKSLDEQAANALRTYDYALAHASEYKVGTVQHFADVARAAVQAAAHPGIADLSTATDAADDKAKKLAATWYDVVNAANAAADAAKDAAAFTTVDYGTKEGQAIANSPNAATLADYQRLLGMEAGAKAWDELQRAIEAGRKSIEAVAKGEPIAASPASAYAGAYDTGATPPSILPPGVPVGTGIGGAGAFQVNVVLDGQVLARVVGNALMRQAKAGRLFPAGGK